MQEHIWENKQLLQTLATLEPREIRALGVAAYSYRATRSPLPDVMRARINKSLRSLEGVLSADLGRQFSLKEPSSLIRELADITTAYPLKLSASQALVLNQLRVQAVPDNPVEPAVLRSTYGHTSPQRLQVILGGINSAADEHRRRHSQLLSWLPRTLVDNVHREGYFTDDTLFKPQYDARVARIAPCLRASQLALLDALDAEPADPTDLSRRFNSLYGGSHPSIQLWQTFDGLAGHLRDAAGKESLRLVRRPRKVYGVFSDARGKCFLDNLRYMLRHPRTDHDGPLVGAGTYLRNFLRERPQGTDAEMLADHMGLSESYFFDVVDALNADKRVVWRARQKGLYLDSSEFDV